MRYLLLAGVAIIALSGCATREQLAARDDDQCALTASPRVIRVMPSVA